MNRGPRITRRGFLAAGAAAALAACTQDQEPAQEPARSADSANAPTTTGRTGDEAPTPTTPVDPTPTTRPTDPPLSVELTNDPFELGVASGDPTPTAVILWTRLLVADNIAIPETGLDVRWEVASDDTFAEVLATDVTAAVPSLALSVHADATGLEPDTWYWYRFRVGDRMSPTGRTRTLPDLDSSQQSLRFGFSSCQHWESGYYSAHRHLSEESLDIFFWLGDYIYESGPTSAPLEATGQPRVHDGPEVRDLQGYRDRYALYKSDPDLKQHHASHPWLVTWDDHEVSNNYAGSIGENGQTTDEFLQLRAAAYRAWYEHMPVRLEPPTGPDFPIHRQFAWGDLAEIFVLDGRQYRDDQPTDGATVQVPGTQGQTLPLRELGPTSLDPNHQFLGRDQQAWMTDGVVNSDRTWKLLAQQVLMQGLSVPLGDGPVTITDTWDGYFANRHLILTEMDEAGVENLVVLSGDLHSAIVGDLRANPYAYDTRVVGTELMASAISSAFPTGGGDLTTLISLFNPQIKHFDTNNGYTVCDLTPERCTAMLRVVTDVADPSAEVETAVTFVIDNGVPGARRA
ncbi:MAG: alkaline phosphatase D family protein [Acidimicrobiales bacterium]